MIDTYILTGFLGVGKTTILNQLLTLFKEEKNVVIENEFGKTNVDNQLIVKHYDALKDLTSGCICCSKDEELMYILSEIAFTGMRPKNVFLECTGIADVNKVASVFKFGDFPEQYRIKSVLCVVDCVSFHKYINQSIEAAIQIIGADDVILNRSSEANIDEIEKLKISILSLNPAVNFILEKELSIEILTNLKHNAKDLSNANIAINKENPHKIITKLYKSSEPFNMTNLKLVFANIFNFYTDSIFRIKGFVKSWDNEVYEVHLTSGLISMKKHEGKIIESSELVFIGIDLREEGLKRLMRSCHSKS